VSEFARLAAAPCHDHAELAAQLARELGGSGGVWVAGRLEALARRIEPSDDPAAELHAVGSLLAAYVEPRADGPLLLPDALAEGRGHPVAVAVAGAGIARRAGVRAGLVGAGSSLYLAHEELDGPFIVDPARPERLVDARSLRCDLLWRCAHESACTVLEHVSERAERQLDLATATACAALRLLLPLDAASRAGAEAEHGRLLARLN
jgi:Transglutaminase-like superfamily